MRQVQQIIHTYNSISNQIYDKHGYQISIKEFMVIILIAYNNNSQFTVNELYELTIQYNIVISKQSLLTILVKLYKLKLISGLSNTNHKFSKIYILENRFRLLLETMQNDVIRKVLSTND